MATVAPVSLSNFTGLDFNQILQATIAELQIPIARLRDEVAADNTSISALAIIHGDFTSLQTSLNVIGAALTNPPAAPTTSAGAPFSASITGAPINGTYAISVSQLASAETVASQGYASDTSSVGTGSITITSGGTPHTITIDSSNDTLVGVAGAITSAGAGVTAQVVDTGLPGAPFRLEITSNATGVAQSFSVATSLSGGVSPDFGNSEIGPTVANTMTGTATPTVGGSYTGALSQGYQFTVTSGGTVGTDPVVISYMSDSGGNGTFTVPAGYSTGTPIAIADGLTLSLGSGTLNAGDQFSVGTFVPQINVAQDAKLQVGSQIVSSATNQVTNAIPGLTLSLNNTGGPATVTIGSDTNALATEVTNFVSAYNALVKDIGTGTQAEPNQAAPPLAADGGLRMILFTLQSQLGNINLSNLGVTLEQSDGTLSFSQSAFNTIEASNPSGVTQALGQLSSGLDPVVTSALDPNTGVIAAETQSDNAQIASLNSQISTLNQQLQAQAAQLQAEYGQIQAEVANFQSLSQLFGSNSSSTSSSSTTGSNLTIRA